LLGDRRVGREIQVGHDLREEKIGAALRIDEAAVLPDPAHARRRREGTLGDRRRVHADAIAESTGETPRRGAGRTFGGVAHRLVIVGAARIACHAAPVVGGEGRGRVKSGEAHDGPRARQDAPRIRSRVARLLEVLHPGVPTGREPVAEPVEALRLLRAREARARESLATRFLAEDARRQKAIG
jgi:hypothetical protein